ncbi:MAG: deoxyribose-phosphate aldolase [Candidatus Zixiibacteriota bacterium]|nr:MAG: deoxyribose-phosphate aldolase [candidate division Zixibacteria bacterium]
MNKRFDHAALKPEVTEKQIVTLCKEARQYDLFAVAVNPVWVSLARNELAGTGIRVVSVAGFPLGASRSEIKVAEAVRAVGDGAQEIDMVANIGWIISGQFDRAKDEISTVRKNLPYNVLLKVIIESGLLTKGQQLECLKIVIDGGAQFVKTSTGFFGGATVDQVARLVKASKGGVEVKASGGIRSLRQCRELLDAGATRLGSSSSAAIMNEYLSRRE